MRAYANRSESERDLMRQEMNRQQVQPLLLDTCVVVLSCMYVPQERRLAVHLIE
ncbi:MULTISPECIES: hypothetical protein [Burkholderiales]|uniref:Nickel-responsive regulator n=1 Tax=Achromobacter veterisilvae TaxID=2069367 RepID=A0A446CST5_9BURK|nr:MULTISPECIES: hypothetical protein [Burkholderiales]BEG78276.1 hypothetical protein HBIAX_05376 [Achromobacter xylosoxidans]SSW70917.1 Putative nickel-responsive regulator [Achromobacter veterisilvae]